MLERLFVGDEYLTLENDETATLKYFVLEHSKVMEETNDDVMTYGFEIEKWTKNTVERDVVYDVTTKKDTAFDVMYMLKENKLMPVHLKDVVADML